MNMFTFFSEDKSIYIALNKRYIPSFFTFNSIRKSGIVLMQTVQTIKQPSIWFYKSVPFPDIFLHFLNPRKSNLMYKELQKKLKKPCNCQSGNLGMHAFPDDTKLTMKQILKSKIWQRWPKSKGNSHNNRVT